MEILKILKHQKYIINKIKEIESLRGIKPKTVYSNWGHSAILTEDNRVFIFGRADRMDMTISLLKYEDAFGNYLKKYNEYN